MFSQTLAEHVWVLTSQIHAYIFKNIAAASQWLQVIHYDGSKYCDSSALCMKHFIVNSTQLNALWSPSLFHSATCSLISKLCSRSSIHLRYSVLSAAVLNYGEKKNIRMLFHLTL